MSTDRRPLFILLGFLLLTIFLVSCEEKPDFIGSDLLPSGDSFTVSFDSMEVIYGYSRPSDSIPTGFKQYYLFGTTVDPFFGRSGTEIISTIAPSVNSRGFGENAVADSVIFYLAIEDRIGESDLPLTLELFEVTEEIALDSFYFSNFDVNGKYREKSLGSTSVTEGDTVIQIFIRDSEFRSKFLNAEDSVLRTREYLQDLMNGLYIKPGNVSDEGSMFRVDFDDPRTYLYFYYRNDTVTGQKQYYSLETNRNARINIFNHDHQGYPIDEYLNNGSNNDSLIFVQSLTGITAQLRFPELLHWMDSLPIAINEARLSFSMADTVYSKQKSTYFPERLSMFTVQQDGTYSLSYDQILDANSFGGIYNPETQSYSFSIKVQVQSILAGDIANLEMALLPYNSDETLSRAVLNGWSNDPAKRIRLEITYTLL
jgi:hypothetical protein